MRLMMKHYESIFKKLAYLGYLGYPGYLRHSRGTSGTPYKGIKN